MTKPQKCPFCNFYDAQVTYREENRKTHRKFGEGEAVLSCIRCGVRMRKPAQRPSEAFYYFEHFAPMFKSENGTLTNLDLSGLFAKDSVEDDR